MYQSYIHYVCSDNANEIMIIMKLKTISITLCHVYLCRQDIGTHNVEEMQRLQEHTTNLEKTVMKYEQQIQELRSDLDMLVRF